MVKESLTDTESRKAAELATKALSKSENVLTQLPTDALQRVWQFKKADDVIAKHVPQLREHLQRKREQRVYDREERVFQHIIQAAATADGWMGPEQRDATHSTTRDAVRWWTPRLIPEAVVPTSDPTSTDYRWSPAYNALEFMRQIVLTPNYVRQPHQRTHTDLLDSLLPYTHYPVHFYPVHDHNH